MLEFLPLLIALVTIGGSAWLFWLTKRKEREQQISVRRAEAYADFFKAQSELEISQGETSDARVLYLDARHRIVLYGSEEVVSALAKYSSTSGNHLEGPKQDTFIALVTAMSKDVSRKNRNSSDILEVLVNPPREEPVESD